MAIGTVKWFNASRGFGFIEPEDGSRDIFVHLSAVARAGLKTLNDGQRVRYSIVTENGKPTAGDIKIA